MDEHGGSCAACGLEVGKELTEHEQFLRVYGESIAALKAENEDTVTPQLPAEEVEETDKTGVLSVDGVPLHKSWVSDLVLNILSFLIIIWWLIIAYRYLTI